MDRSLPLAVSSSFSPFATANSMVSLAPRAVTGARVTRSATATRSPPSSACGLRCLGKARRLELRPTEDVDDSPGRVDLMGTTKSRPAQVVEHSAKCTTLVVHFPSTLLVLPKGAPGMPLAARLPCCGDLGRYEACYYGLPTLREYKLIKETIYDYIDHSGGAFSLQKRIATALNPASSVADSSTKFAVLVAALSSCCGLSSAPPLCPPAVAPLSTKKP